tara:strand:+ start:512 stop:937 length:426 start_codon:yes stop_codon:yes gene_type:complete
MYELVKVAEGLYTHMTGNSGFNTAIGGDASTAGRLYYSQAPENTTFPYVVFFAIDNRDETPTMSESSYAVRVQFSIVEESAAGPRACMDVADKLRARLNRATFGITDHTMMAATVEIERGPVLDDRTHLQTCDYLIRGFED